MVEYPKPNIDELPELYDELDQLLIDSEDVLRNHFSITVENDVEFIVFGEADRETFLRAMHADRDTMIPFFQKIAGLPDREFERLYGVSNLENQTSILRKMQLHSLTLLLISFRTSCICKRHCSLS